MNRSSLMNIPAKGETPKDILEGFLGKQGAKGISKSYQRRYFRLTTREELHYYKTDKTPITKSQGFIDLTKVLSVERGSDVMKRSTWIRGDPAATFNYFFDIITDERTYHVAASTEAEQLQWIDAISQAVHALRPLAEGQSPIARFMPKDASESRSERIASTRQSFENQNEAEVTEDDLEAEETVSEEIHLDVEKKFTLEEAMKLLQDTDDLYALPSPSFSPS